jgi:hypothetical protein
LLVITLREEESGAESRDYINAAGRTLDLRFDSRNDAIRGSRRERALPLLLGKNREGVYILRESRPPQKRHGNATDDLQLAYASLPAASPSPPGESPGSAERSGR